MEQIANRLPDFPNREKLSFLATTPPRSGPLTWAQQHMLGLVNDLQPDSQGLNLKFSWALRAGVTQDEVMAGVRDLVEAHEALRTVCRNTPDGLVQDALPSGDLAVAIVDTDPDEKAAMLVAETLAELPFAIVGEWPVRVAILVHAGTPRFLAFAMSHVVIDYVGVIRVRHHIGTLLAQPPVEPVTPTVVYQPLDEVEWESSATGRHRGARAVEQHVRTFTTMPQTMLPRAVSRLDGPRYRYLEFDSPALRMAVPALARRHNVGPPAVLVAAICSVTGFVSGLDQAFLQLTVGNRNLRTRFAVGMHTLDVPARIDLADADIAGVIARAGTEVVNAARFGQYPPEELARRRREVELARGVALDLSCWLNFRWTGTEQTPNAEPPDRQALRTAANLTRWRWIDGLDNSTSTYFIYADGRTAAMRLTMMLDSAVLPPDEALRWLRAVERLLCTAMTRDVSVAGIAAEVDLEPARRNAEWSLVDGSWAHLPTVADHVRRLAGVRRVDAFTEGDRIVAFLDGASDIDIERLHTDCVNALPGLRTVVAPHRYVVCRGGPARSDIEGWRRLSVVAEGSGRPSL